MTQIQVPGILYSLIAAIAAWATTYFATGNPGGDYIWAPILLATVPVILKLFAEGGNAASATARSFATVERGYWSRVFYG
ncbi:MAG: hypothetical protein KDE19_00460 [Caldilineaceae bacterium]|nr:hypothetical protein [Caldilineaceae bacterium]